MSLRFAGYAAVFDRVDRGGDIVARDAFASLPKRVPLLWQHRGRAVGEVEAIAADAQGLRVIGRIDDPRLASLVEAKALGGLSFGYRVRAAAGKSPRLLRRLDLIEVSLVAQPMQPLARIHAVQPSSREGEDHGNQG